MLVKALLAALVVASAACSPAPDEGVARDAIIRGSPARQYPESVLLDMLKGGHVAAYCSGAVVAPRVVLTAGHCVHGFDGWHVTAPFASRQTVFTERAAIYDYTNETESVEPTQHDVGVVLLGTPIALASYPSLADEPLADGSQVINIGRIDDGNLSRSALFASAPIRVYGALGAGFRYDYIAEDVIQSGDSGGPGIAAGTHTIVAVNSGAGGGLEVLARVDLIAGWIRDRIAEYGGGADGANDP